MSAARRRRAASGREGRLLAGSVRRALRRRPGLAAEAVRTAAAAAPRGWFLRPPFLPLPDPDFLRWRLTTAYGRPDRAPSAREMEDFLAWRRRMRRASSR